MGNQIQHHFHMPPDPPTYTPDFKNLFYIDCTTTKSKIPAVFYECNSDDKSQFTIVFSSPHDSDLGSYTNVIQVLINILRVNILCFDYCGYGLHSFKDKLTEKCFVGNLESVIGYLTKVKSIEPEKIILLGYGIGTGPVISYYSEVEKNFKNVKDVKKKFKLAASVLIFPISPLELIMNSNDRGSKDIFNNLKKISLITIPIFIGFNSKDPICSDYVKKLEKECTTKNLKIVDVNAESEYGIYLLEDDDVVMGIYNFLKELLPESYSTTEISNKSIPSKYLGPHEVVRKWLKNIQMEKYLDLFLMAGYIEFSNQVLRTLNREELIVLGITDVQDQKIFLNHIEDVLTLSLCSDYMISSALIPERNKLLLTKNSEIETYQSQLHGKRVVVAKYLTLTKNHRNAFIQYALQILKLTHPHILSPIHICCEEDMYALIFPWVDGATLRDIIFTNKNEHWLNNDDMKYRIIKDMVDGVFYLQTNLDPPFFHKTFTSEYVLITKHLSHHYPLILGLEQISFNKDYNYSCPPEFNIKPNEESTVYSIGAILAEIFYYKTTTHTITQIIKHINSTEPEPFEAAYPNQAGSPRTKGSVTSRSPRRSRQAKPDKASRTEKTFPSEKLSKTSGDTPQLYPITPRTTLTPRKTIEISSTRSHKNKEMERKSLDPQQLNQVNTNSPEVKQIESSSGEMTRHRKKARNEKSLHLKEFSKVYLKEDNSHSSPKTPHKLARSESSSPLQSRFSSALEIAMCWCLQTLPENRIKLKALVDLLDQWSPHFPKDIGLEDKPIFNRSETTDVNSPSDPIRNNVPLRGSRSLSDMSVIPVEQTEAIAVVPPPLLMTPKETKTSKREIFRATTQSPSPKKLAKFTKKDDD